MFIINLSFRRTSPQNNPDDAILANASIASWTITGYQAGLGLTDFPTSSNFRLRRRVPDVQ